MGLFGCLIFLLGHSKSTTSANLAGMASLGGSLAQSVERREYRERFIAANKTHPCFETLGLRRGERRERPESAVGAKGQTRVESWVQKLMRLKVLQQVSRVAKSTR